MAAGTNRNPPTCADRVSVPLEFICPASDEAGHKTTCERCQLCRGQASPARSVAIVAHGKPSTLRAFGIRVPMFQRRSTGHVSATGGEP